MRNKCFGPSEKLIYIGKILIGQNFEKVVVSKISCQHYYKKKTEI